MGVYGQGAILASSECEERDSGGSGDDGSLLVYVYMEVFLRRILIPSGRTG